MNQSFHSFSRAASEVQSQFSHWLTSMNDATFLQIMFTGAVLLTFVIARALR